MKGPALAERLDAGFLFYMPFKSEAQRRYFNANREKLEREGVDVDEWNAATKGKKLPERVDAHTKKRYSRMFPKKRRMFEK